MKRAAAWSAIAVMILASPPVGAAQSAGQLPAFRAETRLVVLQAVVTNSRGELVTTLDAQAFAVFENGKRQPISLFRRDDVPVSVGLLIDNSGSMRAIRPRVEAAALAFARASNPDDELFVVNFADKVHVDVEMTSDIRVLEAGIARADSIGGTAMLDAVNTAEAYLQQHAKWDSRVLLVITDGNDNASVATVDQIRRLAERTNTVVDAIGLLNDGDQGKARSGRHEIATLTERTGGIAYFPSDPAQIESAALEIARQIRHRYTIGYTPLDPPTGGAFRTVKVTVNGPERYTVRAKTGYRASEARP
jgi:Ca-activated chloride channel homolog